MIIYKTTNLINGKMYVGQDSHNNPLYLGSGKVLGLAIEKYGIENFKKEIIDYATSKNELNEKEIFWISKLNTQCPNGYNIMKGGTGGNTFTNKPEFLKEETRKKLSNNSKEFWSRASYRNNVSNGLRRKWQDPEYAEKMKVIAQRQSTDEDRKQRMSESCKNVIHTNDWNQKVGRNNVIRNHGKKIHYLINEKNYTVQELSNFFNVDEYKIMNAKEFDAEPEVEKLLECYELHLQGYNLFKITKVVGNCPNYGQLKVFFNLMNI